MIKAKRLELSGQVQGCGVRPALVRLARAHGLVGWVSNLGDRVRLHVQGDVDALTSFCDALPGALPNLARLRSITSRDKPVCRALDGFDIRPGRDARLASLPDLPPDTGICERCRAELTDTSSRRFGYPFNACTQCGARLALLRNWPFSRVNTSYGALTPCAECASEAAHPLSRRFGEELVSCPACGPFLRWMTSDHTEGWSRDTTRILGQASECLKRGGVVAVKGMCGFHLFCRSDDRAAVLRIRQIKERPGKPLALLVSDMDMAARVCEVADGAGEWLRGSDRPIVLLPRREPVADDLLAPGLDRLGIMLPATALQVLLVEALDVPLVATSANRRGEPILASVDELRPWLVQGVDAILEHSLDILLPQDDSVVIYDSEFPVVVRRGRGRLHTLDVAQNQPNCVRGEGAWNKNVLAWSFGRRILAGPQTGTRGMVAAEKRRSYVASHLEHLAGIRSGSLVGEAHPEQPEACTAVFHHRSHLAALLLDTGVPEGPALVACWDGLGFGEDDTLWGSSNFLGVDNAWREVSRLRSFPLPGGDACQREPWRVAAACLRETGVPEQDIGIWLAGLDASLPARWRLCAGNIGHAPTCSSLGRFFEAMACIILGSAVNHHEGDIAARLEAFARSAAGVTVELPVPQRDAHSGGVRFDWRPLVSAVWRSRGKAGPALALGLHEALAGMLVQEALLCHATTLGMTGGCFQNVLLARMVRQLAASGSLACITHRELAPNDESLAFGQLALIGGLAGRIHPLSGGH